MISRSALNSRTKRSNGRTPGWAAFDRKQRKENSGEAECDVDPYPSISDTSTPENKIMKHHVSGVSFASIVRAPLNFPLPVADCKSGIFNNTSGANYGHQQFSDENNMDPTVMRLKNANNWADFSLIKDILAAVNNNEVQASAILKAMVSSDLKKDMASCTGLNSSMVSNSHDKNGDCLGERTLVGCKQSDCVSELYNKASDGASEGLMSSRLFSVPLEPEWEDDDVYVRHRKDAIKMMRVASQHSRASSNAFLRGDHLSAHQLSLKAHGEWMAAQELNNKAAKEILLIRNSNNDEWKIDLHGLHASEAVNALNDHLHKIESQFARNHSAFSDGLAKLETDIPHCPSSESLGGLEVDASEPKKKMLPQQRQSIVYVITGTGNHSKGQASIPIAVKSFLIEKGYRFEDTRPGVIAVRPKFRY